MVMLSTLSPSGILAVESNLLWINILAVAIIAAAALAAAISLKKG